MFSVRLFTSSRMFLYLGISLVVLAFVTFPMKIPIQAQPGDVDYFGVGWLFAPIIGIWGLTSIVFGLLQSSLTKRTIESYLIPVLVVVTVGLGYASYMVSVFGLGIIRSVGRGDPFWLLYFGLVLAPSLLIYVASIKFLKSEDRIDFLTKHSTKVATFSILAAVPILYTSIFLLLIYL